MLIIQSISQYDVLKIICNYSASFSVSTVSSTASLRTSEAETITANSALTLEVNLINILYSPTLLIGAFKETFFLSTLIPDLARSSSANFYDGDSTE